jgi:hypothetical protein
LLFGCWAARATAQKKKKQLALEASHQAKEQRSPRSFSLVYLFERMHA